MITFYCLVCKDSKIKPCFKCMLDPQVTISYNDARNIYKIIGDNITRSRIKEFKIKMEKYYESRYLLSEIQDVAINRFKDKTDTRSKNFLNNAITMKNARLLYLDRYVKIREELFALIKKSFPNIYYKLPNMIYNAIEYQAKQIDDTNDCVYKIYDMCKEDLEILWEIKNQKECVDNIFDE